MQHQSFKTIESNAERLLKLKMLGYMALLLSLLNSSIAWGRQPNIRSNTVDYFCEEIAEKGDTLDLKVLHPPVITSLIDSISQALGCKIEIREAKIKTTLNARPTVSSIFKKPQNRRYIIRVNHNPKFRGVHHHTVPDTAKIGLWVHELMHIKDYQSRSALGILQRGWQYLSKNGRKAFEHEIDKMVVMLGYGEPLYQWAQYVMYDSDASPKYKAYKKSVYLTPQQIRVEMEQRSNLTSY